MSIVRRTCAVLAGLVIACLAIDRAAAAPQNDPDVTGTWVLNRDLSDKPGQGGDRGGGDDGSRGPGGRGMGMPGGGGGMSGMGGRGVGFGGGGGMPDPEEMEHMRAAMEQPCARPNA